VESKEENMAKTAVMDQEPCAGRGCRWHDECAFYAPGARVTFGQMDSDDGGWVCESWTRKHPPVVETEPEEGQGQLW
jgi:hypothetical protein